jgi:glutathione S-transferase
MAESSTQIWVPTLHILSSSQAFRVLWALEEIASTRPLKFHVVKLRRAWPPYPDLKKLFPLGKSPILTLETTDGSPPPTVQIIPGVLTEARLILQWLADAYSNGIWIPESEEDKRRDIFFQEFSNSTMTHKMDSVLLFEVLQQNLPFGLKHVVGLLGLVFRPIVWNIKKDHVDIFQLMDDSLSEEKPWFAGMKIGLADFNMAFGMDMAVQRGYFQGCAYPKVAAWHKRITERPAYKKALENGGRYDLVKFS